MKILLTSTSFQDTPGLHKNKLYDNFDDVEVLRGPVNSNVLLPIIGDFHAVICGDDEFNYDVIKKAVKGNLKIISKYGIGLDKIDLEATKKYGVKVYNTPGVNHIAVAEHILALIFSYFKNIHLEYSFTKRGLWNRMIGNEIFSKKVGVLGLGRIGKEISTRLLSLGLDVIVFDKYIDFDFVRKHKINVANNLKDLISKLDILVLTLPLNNETQGIITPNLISNNNQPLVLVNTSRANLIKLEDLISMLDKKIISAYLTDVMDIEPMPKTHPLTKYENVLITPHIGSRTYETVERQGLAAVNNLIDGLNNNF